MKTQNIGRKLEKWCKKQAKKLQKQQATLSYAASVNYAAKSSFSAEPIKQTTAAKK
ncbi:MAG: hypothetical protein LRY74_06360 [Shewanella xiamenensis]|nr:hypothetical protein [Shewanella xiamenensis]